MVTETYPTCVTRRWILGEIEVRAFIRLWIVVIVSVAAQQAWAQNGSPDPARVAAPLEQWLAAGEQDQIRCTIRILPTELTRNQRLRSKVEMQIDGPELERRHGNRLLMAVQFMDKDGRAYQTHKDVDLQSFKDASSKTSIVYSQEALVLPGDYRILLGVVDTATGEHSVAQRTLHVNPLKNDPLVEAWRDLPPVEIPSDGPDSITGRLHLPLNTHRPVHVEILVNTTPSQAVREPGRSQTTNASNLEDLFPVLDVLAQMEPVSGLLNVALLDLARQQVIFEQSVKHDLNWAKLLAALKQADPNVIDARSLQNRAQRAQFFVKQVDRRLGSSREDASNAPLHVVIVLSGSMAFDPGTNLHPIEATPEPGTKVFYIRCHPPMRQAQLAPDFDETQRRRRGGPVMRNLPPLRVEAPDALEPTLKPLQPRVTDVYTPEQFRKALAGLLDEISRM